VAVFQKLFLGKLLLAKHMPYYVC